MSYIRKPHSKQFAFLRRSEPKILIFFIYYYWMFNLGSRIFAFFYSSDDKFQKKNYTQF